MKLTEQCLLLGLLIVDRALDENSLAGVKDEAFEKLGVSDEMCATIIDFVKDAHDKDESETEGEAGDLSVFLLGFACGRLVEGSQSEIGMKMSLN